MDEARAELALAVDLDPLSPVMYDSLGLALYDAGRIDEAIVWASGGFGVTPREAGEATGRLARGAVPALEHMLGRARSRLARVFRGQERQRSCCS